MRTFYLYLPLILIVAMDPSIAQTEKGRRAVDTVAQKASAGDLRGLIDILPSLEPVWSEDPQAYLDALKANVHALIASGNPEAMKAAVATFPKLIEKKSPAGTAAVISYVKVKSAIINEYFQPAENRQDKEFLLGMASFLGEVRALRIPGYQIRYYNRPGHEILEAAGVPEVKDLPTQAQKDAVAAAVKQAEEDQKMNELQNGLSSIEWSTFNTIESGVRRGVAMPDAEKPAFYQELAKRAKLTEEEVKELGLPQVR